MPPPVAGNRSAMRAGRALRSAAAAVGFASIAIVSAAVAQFPSTRVAATTLRMPSEASTSAYKTSPAFGGVAFEQPVQVVFAPAETQRAFIVERPGRVSIVAN